MKSILSFFVAGATFGVALSSANADVLGTPTTLVAKQTPVYGVYHDVPTNFVFVKLPRGWVFVGRDDQQLSHEVFFDGSSGSLFVELSSGWSFVGLEAD